MNTTDSLSTTGWTDYLQNVSPVVTGVLWLLLGLSFLTWFLILYKALEFWQARRGNKFYAEKFWSAEAISSMSRGKDINLSGPFSQLTASGMQALERYYEHYGTALERTGELTETVTRALRQSIQDCTTKLEAGLGLLATIGNTAPFIGLFGTVIGIMSALKDISLTGAAGLDVVAGPIGEALVATAAGLACAIPAVVAYNSFVRRLRVLTNTLDGFAHDLLARILAESAHRIAPTPAKAGLANRSQLK